MSPAPAALWPLRGHALLLALAGVALAYAGAATVSLLLAISPGYASAVWPPSGIAVAAWLAFGPRVWPAILVGAAVANFGVIGTPAPVALAIGAGNAAEAAAAGWLLQRLLAPGQRFDRPADVWIFAGVAFAAAAVAATNGVVVLALAGAVPWAEFAQNWLTWWLGDATGIVIVAPLLLCWARPGPAEVGRTAERQVFAALLALFAVFAWRSGLPGDTVQKLAYLVVPLVAWAAGRLDQRAVTAASFFISVVGVVDMLDGTASLFAPMPRNESLLLLQLFMSSVALAGLTLAAYAGELARVNAELRAAQRQAAMPAPPAAVAPAAGDLLTATESEIVRLVADGKSNAEAARILGLSPRTVETYRGRVMEKLHLDSAAALVKYAVRRGLSRLD